MENETNENVVIDITPTPVRDFIARHKTKIAVGATAVTCMVLHTVTIKAHNDFLKEHDLYDEYYSDPSDPSDLYE